MTVEEGIKHWAKKRHGFHLNGAGAPNTDDNFMHSIYEWVSSGSALTTFQANRVLRIFGNHGDSVLRAIALAPTYTLPVEASKVFNREVKGVEGYALFQTGKNDTQIVSILDDLGSVPDPEARHVYHIEITPNNVSIVFDLIKNWGFQFDDATAQLIADAMQTTAAVMVEYEGSIYASVQADPDLAKWLVDVMGAKIHAPTTYRMAINDRNIRLARRLASEGRVVLSDDFSTPVPRIISPGFSEREIAFIDAVLDHDFLVTVLGPVTEWGPAYREAVRISGRTLFTPAMFPLGLDEERINNSEMTNAETVASCRSKIAIARSAMPALDHHPRYTVVGDAIRRIGCVHQHEMAEKSFFNHYVVW